MVRDSAGTRKLMLPDPGRYLVRLTMMSDGSTMGVLRSRIEASLPWARDDIIADIQLVATELVTNALLHGEPPVRFDLLAAVDGRPLRIEVSDCGTTLPLVREPWLAHAERSRHALGERVQQPMGRDGEPTRQNGVGRILVSRAGNSPIKSGDPDGASQGGGGPGTAVVPGPTTTRRGAIWAPELTA